MVRNEDLFVALQIWNHRCRCLLWQHPSLAKAISENWPVLHVKSWPVVKSNWDELNSKIYHHVWDAESMQAHIYSSSTFTSMVGALTCDQQSSSRWCDLSTFSSWGNSRRGELTETICVLPMWRGRGNPMPYAWVWAAMQSTHQTWTKFCSSTNQHDTLVRAHLSVWECRPQCRDVTTKILTQKWWHSRGLNDRDSHCCRLCQRGADACHLLRSLLIRVAFSFKSCSLDSCSGLPQAMHLFVNVELGSCSVSGTTMKKGVIRVTEWSPLMLAIENSFDAYEETRKLIPATMISTLWRPSNVSEFLILFPLPHFKA